ncbi:peptide deformylase [soil metagenome]
MSSFTIRELGDPVLRQQANDITDIDGRLVQLVDDMFDTMYAAPGTGLAAPQVGVQKRLFVYDVDDTPGVLINPTIVESDGESVYEEGCLSIPGFYFEVTRPRSVRITGTDLDGNDVDLDTTDFWARMFQHELDHLTGTLVLEHLQPEQRKVAKRLIRLRTMEPGEHPTSVISADGQVRVLDR